MEKKQTKYSFRDWLSHTKNIERLDWYKKILKLFLLNDLNCLVADLLLDLLMLPLLLFPLIPSGLFCSSYCKYQIIYKQFLTLWPVLWIKILYTYIFGNGSGNLPQLCSGTQPLHTVTWSIMLKKTAEKIFFYKFIVWK